MISVEIIVLTHKPSEINRMQCGDVGHPQYYAEDTIVGKFGGVLRMI